MKVVHLTAAKQSIRDAVRAAGDTGEAVLLPWGTFCQLGNELGGGQHSASGWLRELVATTGHPVAFAAPSCDTAAEAHIFTPAAWSNERALGWLGVLHGEVEAILGPTNIIHERVGASGPAGG